MIDFNSAPEGATHYIPATNTTYLIWVKNIKDESFEINCPENSLYESWEVCNKGLSYYKDYRQSIVEIPIQKDTDIKKENGKLTVFCNTERELMLCEQLLRVVRGEPSQELVNTYWKDVQPDHIINIDKLIRYRAKPKKKLVVPWDFLREDIDEVVVTKDGFIKGYANGSEYYQLYGLSLDLEGIEIPVAVKRP